MSAHETSHSQVDAVLVPGNRPFDRDAALAQLDGDRELLAEVAQLFLEDSVRLLEDIREAVGRRDALTLHRAAHTLKGAATYLVATPTIAAAQRLEMVGKSDDLSNTKVPLAILEMEIARLRPALAELLEVIS